MYSSSHQRMLHTGSKSLITWLILITIVLYTLYSSNIILFNNDQQDCPTITTNLNEATQENLRVSTYNNTSSKTIATDDESVEKKKPLVEKRPREDNDDDEEEGEEKNKEEEENKSPVVVRLTPKQMSERQDTELKHVVFGIAGSSNLWHIRKEYIKIWWRPKETRGVVWLDKKVRSQSNEGLPDIYISGDTSKFRYTNRQGQRSALRISRVVTETLKLGMKDMTIDTSIILEAHLKAMFKTFISHMPWHMVEEDLP